MDITDIILEQHAQQRAAFAQLEEWPKQDVEGLTALWQRLQIFLETHAEAEERFFYPHLLDEGTGAADADDGTVEGEVEDAIKDHNKLRDAIRRAGEVEVGSDAWWEAVTDADVANSDHMGEEERQDLRDFRDHASLQQRHDIAVEFLRWQAQKAADGITPVNKDAEAYVEDPEAELAQAEDSAQAASGTATKAAKKAPAQKAPAQKAAKKAPAKKATKKAAK